MPSLTYLLLTLTSILATTTCTPLEAGAQKPLVIKAPNNTIPGGSTLKYCAESDPENDIFSIDRIIWEPNPPTISRDQKLLIHGSFTTRIPSTATGTGTIHIPEWHDPYSPPSNYTETNPFCAWPNYVLQSDEERGEHRVCDGRVGGNYSAPEAGPAVLVGEDILFWPLPEGEYYAKLDMKMPETEDGAEGKRIFCFEGVVYLDY